MNFSLSEEQAIWWAVRDRDAKGLHAALENIPYAYRNFEDVRRVVEEASGERLVLSDTIELDDPYDGKTVIRDRFGVAESELYAMRYR